MLSWIQDNIRKYSIGNDKFTKGVITTYITHKHIIWSCDKNTRDECR